MYCTYVLLVVTHLAYDIEAIQMPCQANRFTHNRESWRIKLKTKKKSCSPKSSIRNSVRQPCQFSIIINDLPQCG
ncbi:uncharacterized protein GGS25DRAFT_477232 [Hypoxylon fragiforme]|uniref:uncharacterized protein n=1 Tax=Hypoxylon fragiforme TaxID=63214 RepID=UPI0020C70413|nr:uncharacterized protein GGS25DRAFT_477232 [Hypoxylon fragiforme]KAI2612822.1 hypothetical protein GGS25DRAFT_477232 [Hypoxylon fragiforme]